MSIKGFHIVFIVFSTLLALGIGCYCIWIDLTVGEPVYRTGAIASFYMGYHTWHLRFTGVHLLSHPAASFGKVQMELQNPWIASFYVIGIVAASWHFAYGLWLFAAKWGITTGETARRRWGYVCALIAIAFIAVGMLTMRSFFQWPQQPLDNSSGAESFVMR